MQINPNKIVFRYDVYLIVDGKRYLAKGDLVLYLAEQLSRRLLRKYKKFGYSVEIKPVEVT